MSFIIIIFSLFHVSTFSNVAVSYFTRWLVYTRDGTGQDFFDPTSKFQNHRRLTGRSTGFRPARSTGFLPKVFLHYSMYLMKNFQKGGGHWWGVKNCDLRRGSQKKKTQKNFCVFCKNDSILRPFLVKFRFERPVLSSAKRVQNKHKSTGGHKLNY